MINNIVDLSHYQTVSDFDKVKQAGIDAIIHKATQGTSYVDNKYISRRDYCRENRDKFLFGSYHFLSANKDGVEQAKHFIDVVEPIDGEILVCDWELDNGILAKPSVVEDFINSVGEQTESKIACIVYASDSVITLHKHSVGTYDFWIARYGKKPVNDFSIWQYSESATVDGIGTCDRNYFNGTKEEMLDFWGATSRAIALNGETVDVSNDVPDNDSTTP